MTQDLVRLNVNLNRETADALKSLADLRGTTVTEVVRRAVTVMRFLEDEKEAGRVILTSNRNGKKVRELVIYS